MIIKKQVTPVCLMFVLVFVWTACSRPDFPLPVTNGKITITFNNQLHSRVTGTVLLDRKSVIIDKAVVFSDYFPSEYIVVDGTAITDFAITGDERATFSDWAGDGKIANLTGRAGSIEKTVSIKLYDKFPNMAIYQVHYKNLGETDIIIDRWVNHDYRIYTKAGVKETAPFWTLQSGSFPDAPLQVRALQPGVTYSGKQDTAIGYRLPLSTVWSNQAGLAVGHVESFPYPVALPVMMPAAEYARLGVEYYGSQTLGAGQTFSTIHTIVLIYQYDFFQVLRDFRNFLTERGLSRQQLTAELDSLASAGTHSPSQVRLNAKIWRAIAGDETPYRVDRAGAGAAMLPSILGVGARVYPDTAQLPQDRLSDLYRSKRLYNATYRGDLFDIAYDQPEGHAIRRQDTLYLSYFAEGGYAGEITIRDMAKNRKYTVRSLDGQRTFRTLTGEEDTLMVRFDGYLLLEVFPAEGEPEQK